MFVIFTILMLFTVCAVVVGFSIEVVVAALREGSWGSFGEVWMGGRGYFGLRIWCRND